MEKLIANPTVATIITFLVIGIVAFVKGTVVSGVAVTQLRADYEARLKEVYDRVEKANIRADQWMEIAMRTTGAAKDLIDVAKSREVRDSEERERGR